MGGNQGNGESSGGAAADAVRAKSLDALTQLAATGLATAGCQPFSAALARLMGLLEIASPQALIQALDATATLDDRLALVRGAVRNAGSAGDRPGIEQTASALYLRAAVAAVDLEMARTISQPGEAVTLAPQKHDLVIAILAATMHEELRDFQVDPNPAPGERVPVRGAGLTDLDARPMDPLRTRQAISEEAAARLVALGAVRYETDWQQKWPSDPGELDDWHEGIRLAAAESRRLGKPIRFVTTKGNSELLDDDAVCRELSRNLGIPFTRVDPARCSAEEIKQLLGISPFAINRAYGELLTLLKQGRQPPVPEARPAVPMADPSELLAQFLALLKENQSHKAELQALTQKLEASSTAPTRTAIQEVLDTVEKGKKLGEGAEKYAEFLHKAYEIGRTLMDLLP